jgi:hypothetical protein
MLFAAVFFGACLVFYAWRAATNDRGLIINGFIELGTGGATAFFAIFAVASAVFVAAGLWAITARFRAPSYLLLEEDRLEIPSRWGRRPRTVRYSEIRDIQLLNVQGQSLLQLATDAGRVTLAAMMLASDAQLREIGATLRDRVRANVARR